MKEKEFGWMINFEGLFIEKLNIISDNRGSVLKFISKDSKGYKKFGECYISEIKPGVIKAWKLHKIQTQNMAILDGKIKLNLYDLRKNSESYKENFSLEVGRPNNYFRITIPPGILYGFKCISKNKAIIINCTDIEHDPKETKNIGLEEYLFKQ